MMRGNAHERGAALLNVIVTALLFAAAAYSMLTVSIGNRQRAKQFNENRLRAHYIAEAALVKVYQNLYQNEAGYLGCVPNSTANKVLSVPIDTDGNGIDDTNVSVTVSNCGAGLNHAVTASMIY